MTDNLRDNNSYSSIKSLKNRLQSMQSSDRADGIKKSLNHINNLRKNMGSTLQGMFSGKSDSSVYSKGVRELDSYGYEKYNLNDDGREIFISKVPEKAFFNDGEPLMVRATGGNFVGGSLESTFASIDITEAQVKVENPRSLFINVPQDSTIETEYRATLGEVTADGTIKPKPLDSAFLDRMKSFNSSERPVTRIVLEDEVPETEPEPVVKKVYDEDAPKFLQIDDDLEELVEEPVKYSFLDRIFGSRSRKPVEEFFADDPVEEPVVEEDSEDDYDWISFDEEESQKEVFVEVPVEKSIFEESVIKEPVVGFVEFGEEVSETKAPIEPVIEEIAIKVPAEEIHIEEVPVKEPIEQDAQVPAKHVVSEISVEEVTEEVVVEEPVTVVTLRNIPVEPPESIAGVEMEGSEPSAGSVLTEDIFTSNMIAQTAETSAEAEPASTTFRFNGLEEDGEAYPPLSDPVVKRPKTVRFRFNNGVLQNVKSNDNKSEPREELRGPLE